AGSNSQAQTGSSLRASRFTIFTRAGSPSALNSFAVDSASSSESDGAASGWQQAIARNGTAVISANVNISMNDDLSSGSAQAALTLGASARRGRAGTERRRSALRVAGRGDTPTAPSADPTARPAPASGPGSSNRP